MMHTLVAEMTHLEATVPEVLTVSVVAAANRDATVSVMVAMIVFAVETEATKRYLARVRKIFREKMLRNRLKVLYKYLTVRTTVVMMMIRTLVSNLAHIEATLGAMLAVIVFAAETKVANIEATVIAILADIVFAVGTKASERDLARVRKNCRDIFVRNQCKVV